jgi:putative ABC transport system permease protein
MGALVQDLKYALRGLLRNPLFAVTALAAAALGIGAATAVFSVVDRILFRALPYRDAGELVSVGMLAPLDRNEFLLAGGYFTLRRDHPGLASVTSFVAGVNDCDLSDEHPVRLGCLAVEGNFLPVLGIAPALGRSFTPEEDRPGAPKVGMMSFALWRGRFGGDPGIVGRVLQLDGQPLHIVGVLPADFETPTLARADLILPEQLNEATESSGRALRVFGRMRPGSTIEQAGAALAPWFQTALEGVPAPFRKEVKLRLRSLRDRQVDDVRRASWVLIGAVLAVLLIACANIANLLLARAAGREREWMIRLALGAGRWRRARQMLSESLLLGVLGGVAGCGLAWLLLRWFVSLAPGGIPRIEQAALDGRVLGFALAASALTGILFGMAPALRNPVAIRVGRARLREWLVTAQLAVSVVLLAGAGILLKNLWHIANTDFGMDTEHVVTASFTLSKVRYATDRQQLEFVRRLEESLARLPGAAAVAISDSLPPTGGTRGRPLASIQVEGRPPFDQGTGGLVMWRYVTPGYFAALRIPIAAGRGFVESDRGPGEAAIVVSESLARRLSPGENAVGRRIKTDAWGTIVGVARDVKNSGLDRSDPEYYVVRKYAADDTYGNQGAGVAWRHAFVVVRTAGDRRAMSQWLRAEFAALDTSLPVESSSLAEHAGSLASRPRFQATLIGLFAAMGVLLAAIGLYGVMAFLVAQRTREIGVRMALGASPGSVSQLVLARAARWTLAGAAIGLAGSLYVGRLLQALLFDAPASDPWILLAVVALLFACAMGAAWIPARRAARVDPMTALRHE